jgi:hypothetical protein
MEGSSFVGIFYTRGTGKSGERLETLNKYQRLFIMNAIGYHERSNYPLCGPGA